MKDYELYHHGIKGQKWGVRRTAAQLGHRVAKAGKAVGKFAGKQAVKAKKAASASYKQHKIESKEKRYYAKLHKKKLSQMTDKEIQDLTNRVKKEAVLKDAKYESRVQNARKFYDNVAKGTVNNIVNEYSKRVIERAFTKDDSSNNGDGDSNNKEVRQGKVVKDNTFSGKTRKLAKKKGKDFVENVNKRPVRSKTAPTIRR